MPLRQPALIEIDPVHSQPVRYVGFRADSPVREVKEVNVEFDNLVTRYAANRWLTFTLEAGHFLWLKLGNILHCNNFAHKIGEVRSTHFFHYPGSVIFNGARADLKFERNFLIGQTFCNQQHDLSLAG